MRAQLELSMLPGKLTTHINALSNFMHNVCRRKESSILGHGLGGARVSQLVCLAVLLIFRHCFFKTRCSQNNPKQAKQVLEIFPKILPPDHVMKLENGLLPVTCFWCQSIPLFFLQRLCSQRKYDGERGFRTKQTHKQKSV